MHISQTAPTDQTDMVEVANPFDWKPEDYLDTSLPYGYRTILGWLAETNPEALALIERPVKSMLEDQCALDNLAFERNLPVGITNPPPPLVGCVGYCRFYPVSLLRDFTGD